MRMRRQLPLILFISFAALSAAALPCVGDTASPTLLQFAAAAQDVAQAANRGLTRSHGFDPINPLTLPKGFQSLDNVNPEAPKGGALRLEMYYPANTLVPIDWGGMGLHRMAPVYGTVFQTLMTGVPSSLTGHYGLLADSIEYPDDLKSVTFHLRPEARFNDGSPVTADDVQFSYETLLQSDPTWNRDGVFRDVKGVEVVDSLTVRFRLDAASTIAARETIDSLAAGIFVMSKAFYSIHPLSGAGSTAIPVGTGPYRVTSFDPDQKVELTRNKDYWAKDLPIARGQYNFDRLEFHRIYDDSVARLELTAGDITCREESSDAYWHSEMRGLPPNSPLWGKEIPLQSPPRFYGLAFNAARSGLNDVRARRALSVLFDFEFINRTFYDGALVRSNSFFQGTQYAHAANMSEKERELLAPFRASVPADAFSSDPSSALQMKGRDALRSAFEDLKAAGWRFDRDQKKFVDASGQPIRLTLLYSSGSSERMFLNYQASLRRLGVELELIKPDQSRFMAERNKGNYDMIYDSYYGTAAPVYTRLYDHFSSTGIGRPEMDNVTATKNPAVDALLEKLKNAKTEEDRIASARALDRILLSEFYHAPIGARAVQKLGCRSNVAHPDRPSPYWGIDMVRTGWQRPESGAVGTAQ